MEAQFPFLYLELSREWPQTIAREVEEEAARTTKYYFIKIHCKSVVFIIILCSLFISICCTYIDTNFDSQNVYYIYLATYLFWH